MAKMKRRPKQECSKGHRMDPNWTSCPYCEAEERAQQKSNRPGKAAAGRRETSVGDIPESPRRVTRPMQGQQADHKPMPSKASENRKIMGVLISYAWRPEGELFAVREGKNYIGRGKVSSDASHRDCDVMIPKDTRMSNEHALILCRHGKYEIIDRESSNGTFLNGEMLMTNQSIELGDSAEIRTGDTVWSFFKIAPPEGVTQETTSTVESTTEEETKNKSDKDSHIY